MRNILILCVLAVLMVLVFWRVSSLVVDPVGPSPGIAAEAPALESEELGEARDELVVAATAVGASARSEAAAVEPGAAETVGAATGSLLVRTVLEDGEELADMRVVVMPRSPERLGGGVREVDTDSTGTVRVEQLDPGRVSIWSPLGARAGADVVAGEQVQVDLVYRNVVDVAGIVVDPAGVPVSGAQVWVASRRRDWLGLHPVAQSGPDGRFDVRHVHVDKSLGASATRLGPSELSDLSLADTSSSPVELRLELTAEGGDLQGRVSDPAGASVAGALVAVGESPRGYETRRDGTDMEQWTARVAVTDPAGGYRIDGLASGRQPLVVRASGFPLLAAEVEVLVGETSVLDLALERGMSVRGIVRDEAGHPVEGAIVLALDAPFEDPFPTQGPTDRGAPFNRPGMRSGADGSFHLRDLPSGDAHLYASKGTSYWDRGNFVGTVQETLSGEPGQALEWHPVLTRGREIRGRVTYADGSPMPNVFVSAIRPDDERRYTEHADAEGRFAIPGLESRAYTVSVQLWDAPEDAGRLERDDVWPSEGELVLIASYSKTLDQRSTVHATIVDAGNRVEGRGTVVFAHERGWYHADEEDGVFSARVPPGRYQARAMYGDDVVGTSDWFELAAGEERFVGAVYTSPACSLLVRVERPASLASSSVRVGIETDYRSRRGGRRLPSDEGEMTFGDLLEGPVDVWLGGVGVASERRRVEVRAGAPTEVEFELEPAVSCSFELHSAQTTGFGRVTLVLTHSEGGVYTEVEWFERWGAELPLESKLFVPLGHYQVEVTTTSGLAASGELVVESLSAAPGLRLELK